MTSSPKLMRLLDNLAVAASQGPRNWSLARRAITRHGAIQKVRELSTFVAMLRRRRPRPRVVAEIGTAQGGTFWALAHVADPKATLISLDLPPQQRHSGGENRAIDLNVLCLPGQTVHQILGDSHSPQLRDQVRGVLGERQIDLLFIDGDHTYEGVRADFELYSPLVAADGLIGFHDIAATQWEHCGVGQLWRELVTRKDYRPLEIIDPRGANMGGIGLLSPQRQGAGAAAAAPAPASGVGG